MTEKLTGQISTRGQGTQVGIKKHRWIWHPMGGDVDDTDGTLLNSL